MAIKPILFNTAMVQAILDGRKTVTRRLVKPQPDSKRQSPLGYVVGGCKQDNEGYFGWGIDEYGGHIQYAKPPYNYGDILYVRETWKIEEFYDDEALIRFKASGEIGFDMDKETHDKLYKFAEKSSLNWQPSLFMPREAARIFLKVTGARVERLQDITEEQARNEGCITYNEKIGDGKFEDAIEFDLTAIDAFTELWNSTVDLKHKPELSWSSNPWVWVIEFERCEKPEEREER